jgi:RNA chaperone Hfq
MDDADLYSENITDRVFSLARRNGSALTLFLDSGEKLTGTVREFDSYSILFSCDGERFLVYKSAITWVSRSTRRAPENVAARALKQAEPAP